MVSFIDPFLDLFRFSLSLVQVGFESVGSLVSSLGAYHLVSVLIFLLFVGPWSTYVLGVCSFHFQLGRAKNIFTLSMVLSLVSAIFNSNCGG